MKRQKATETIGEVKTKGNGEAKKTMKKSPSNIVVRNKQFEID